MQTLAYKSVINVTKQMTIFNHKNKICGKAKNYLLRIIGGAKAPPAPPAPRSLIGYTQIAQENIIFSSQNIFDSILSESKGCSRKTFSGGGPQIHPIFGSLPSPSVWSGLECPCVPLRPLCPTIAPASLAFT